MCYRLIFYLKLINNKFSLFILSGTFIEINLLTTFSFVQSSFKDNRMKQINNLLYFILFFKNKNTTKF